MSPLANFASCVIYGAYSSTDVYISRNTLHRQKNIFRVLCLSFADFVSLSNRVDQRNAVKILHPHIIYRVVVISRNYIVLCGIVVCIVRGRKVCMYQ